MSNQRKIEELYIDVEIKNQHYDYSSPVKDEKKATARVPAVSLLGKRKFNDAFDEVVYENERYNQHIASDFFDKNTGHNVYVPYDLEEGEIYEEHATSYNEKEILEWIEFYKNNRNLFRV